VRRHFHPSTTHRLGTALLVGLASVAAVVVPARASGTAPPPPHVPVPQQGTGAVQGYLTELGATDSGMPPGVVNGPCTPSPDHPYPVVLVHGTFANENMSWQTLAPLLSNAGYCVFGLNYGATSWTTQSHDHSYGVDFVESSAAQLESFISGTVLPDTVEPAGNVAGYAAGANPAQVDLVGHSQGGMLPRYLIDTTSSSTYPGLGHAAQVHTLVGLAPSNHGTDGGGAIAVFHQLFGDTVYTFASSSGCGACGEQEAGSPFLRALNGQADATGVDYYMIETNRDEVVTPYTSAFLPATENVQNVTLQDQCPTDLTDHLGIIYDPVAVQDVMSALANNTGVAAALPQPSCPPAVAPVVSG
jgi:pimeloyl-ACP methyl ester carboxylesterase